MEHAEYVPRPLHEEGMYYLPVHGVLKEDSTTTKLRAVFDASAPTTTGKSLNDLLDPGPNLYTALSDVPIRFRSHRIGLTADIGKMLREIYLHEEERDLHRFFLRTEDGTIQDCRMTRLTFGVTSSPFIATQTLRHLATSHSESSPEASNVILKDFYVDDCLTSVDTVEEGVRLQQSLYNLLQTAGMTLRKWRTSSQRLLHAIPEELRETSDLAVVLSTEAPKALGVHWDAQQDILHVSTPVDIDLNVITKRTIASTTAKVFDVLGLMAPAVIPALILLQSIWRLSLQWDEPVPPDIRYTGETWTKELLAITSCSIPRRMSPSDSPVVFWSLHGFSDASTTAYGAAVYLRTLHEDGTTHVTLVTAKARVIPLKPIMIPRAELVAASLLSKLITHVARILDVPLHSIHAWTDSAIVIHWLHKPPSALKTFVANRVGHIQEHLPATHWNHVPTKDNPADLLSRGCRASDLCHNDLWWHGPSWLLLGPDLWKRKKIVNLPWPIPETKPVATLKVTPASPTDTTWSSFKTFPLAIRVMAWVTRFTRYSQIPDQTGFANLN